MSVFKNKKSTNFLGSIPKKSLTDHDDKTTDYIKFNFHYLDSTKYGGENFIEWSYAST